MAEKVKLNYEIRYVVNPGKGVGEVGGEQYYDYIDEHPYDLGGRNVHRFKKHGSWGLLWENGKIALMPDHSKLEVMNDGEKNYVVARKRDVSAVYRFKDGCLERFFETKKYITKMLKGGGVIALDPATDKESVINMQDQRESRGYYKIIPTSGDALIYETREIRENDGRPVWGLMGLDGGLLTDCDYHNWPPSYDDYRMYNIGQRSHYEAWRNSNNIVEANGLVDIIYAGDEVFIIEDDGSISTDKVNTGAKIVFSTMCHICERLKMFRSFRRSQNAFLFIDPGLCGKDNELLIVILRPDDEIIQRRLRLPWWCAKFDHEWTVSKAQSFAMKSGLYEYIIE